MLKLRITWNLFLSKTSRSLFHHSCQVQTVPWMIKLRHCFLTLLQNITFRLQFLIISQNFVRKCSPLVKLQKVLLVVELRHTWSPGWHRLVQKCRSQPFTIMCDESNDYGNDKCMLCYFIKVFDDNLGSTQTRFLAVMLIVKEHSQWI